MANKRYLLGTLLVAGTALAACGSSAQTSAATTTTSSKAKTTGAKTVAKPVVNTSNGSPGFNASKTVFVLPHNLGDLFAPELALAKSDPAYAAGLLTPADWVNIPPYSGATSNEQGWIYMGTATGPNTGGLVSAKLTVADMWVTTIAGPNHNTGAHFSITSSTPISASQLNSYSLAPVAPVAVGQGYTVVTPSVLEVRAAPVGTMSVNGTSIPAFCTPTPEGVVQNGQIVTPGGTPLTAGPSAMFTVPNQGQNVLYDQGVSSCAGFN